MTKDNLKSLLAYDPNTGIFAWKDKSRCVKNGDIAGSISNTGYIRIGIKGKSYKAHRLAWLYMTGEIPNFEIVHINRNRSDNRFENLQIANKKQNIKNTAERFFELLSYNSESGVISWKVSNSRRAVAGNIAGSKHNAGYERVRVDGTDYLAHRIAWLLHTGEWPKGYIDHINGKRDDNRIENIRDVTPAENMQNQRKSQRGSKSGYLGVFKVCNRYKAEISINGKSKHLGMFSSAEEAHAAYLKTKRIFHNTCSI